MHVAQSNLTARPLALARPYVSASFTTHAPIGFARPTICKRKPTELLVPSAVAAPPSLNGGSAHLTQSESEQAYLASRTRFVNEHFPKSLSIDDFVHRLETVLYDHGFNGENTIACTNVCRDEITAPLRDKIDLVFGQSFNVNGLGGVLTCGVLGMGAGLSHSPVGGDGKERYVFFSFPHIAVSPHHDVGGLRRFNRPGNSSACGALCKALADLQSEGVSSNATEPGGHDPTNPEYSILKQRLARRLKSDGVSESDIKSMDLVYLTKVAERTITSDLEELISAAVDKSKADYAVITGVQIHSWGEEYDDSTPNLEYVQPCAAYAVVNGQRKDVDLSGVPALTPRQSREVAVVRGSFHGSGKE